MFAARRMMSKFRTVPAIRGMVRNVTNVQGGKSLNEKAAYWGIMFFCFITSIPILVPDSFFIELAKHHLEQEEKEAAEAEEEEEHEATH